MNDKQKKKQLLQDDLKQLVADTKELLGSTADISDKAAKAARLQVETSLKSIQNHVESGFSVVEDKVEEQLKDLDQHIQANPYKTIGISFGVGVLLGIILGRK
jgi:ElaB/YqjD/DUF883 family membrane-anchored ribosome-binding protein